jgi:hypothetical protein
MSKNRFYREDYPTFKKKYSLLCDFCEFKINKFGELENKSYISKIIITESK